MTDIRENVSSFPETRRALADAKLVIQELTAPGGAGAPSDAQYIVRSLNATLSDEYVATTSSTVSVSYGAGTVSWVVDESGLSAFVRRDGTLALTGNWDAGSFEIRAETFESDVATGTAPLTIASTTKVTNLNADLLDDKNTGTSGNTIPLLDGVNTWSGLQTFDAEAHWNDADKATFGNTHASPRLYIYADATASRIVAGNSLWIDGLNLDSVCTGDYSFSTTAGNINLIANAGNLDVNVLAGNFDIAGLDARVYSSGSNLNLLAGEEGGVMSLTADMASISISSSIIVSGVMTNIGNGTYTVADGDNDLGVDGDFEVNGTAVIGSLTGILKATSGTVSVASAGSDYQAGDATLTALAAYSTNGLLTQTAADTFTGRSIAVTASTGLSVSNGNGVSGNPTLAGLDAAYLTKGVASFSVTNFTVTLGAVNTIQNISTGSSPTFANLNIGAGGLLSFPVAKGVTPTIAGASALITLKAANITFDASGGPGGSATYTEGLNLIFGTSTGSKLAGASNQKMGAWGATPVVRQSAFTQTYSTADKTLGAYTSDPESSTYTGIDNLQIGTPYAQVSDLNALRTAYETLRTFTEDAVAMLNSVIDDLQTIGWLA